MGWVGAELELVLWMEGERERGREIEEVDMKFVVYTLSSKFTANGLLGCWVVG